MIKASGEQPGFVVHGDLATPAANRKSGHAMAQGTAIPSVKTRVLTSPVRIMAVGLGNGLNMQNNAPARMMRRWSYWRGKVSGMQRFHSARACSLKDFSTIVKSVLRTFSQVCWTCEGATYWFANT